MKNNINSQGRRKSVPNDAYQNTASGLNSLEGYAVRAIARRARVSLNYARLAAELAGILKEGGDG